MADLPIKPVEVPVRSVETPDVLTPSFVEVSPEAVETLHGSAPEIPSVESIRESQEFVVPSPTFVPVRPSVLQKDPLTVRIEDILSEDMTDVFLKMSSEKQIVFKEKGEEIASKIRQMIHATKVNAKKMFDMICEWLKLIPGVNRFFLEQEAKIKTDKILNLKP